MSTKFMNFLTMSWFVSTLICLIMEGSYFGTAQNNIINGLSILTSFNVLNIFTVPVFNVNFIGSVMRILLWDYSFYSGGYIIVRYFWLAILTPGAVWGFAQAFIWMYGQILTLFKVV